MLEKEFEIAVGDTVCITLPNNWCREGIVKSAKWWGSKHGWYIEFTWTVTDTFSNITAERYGYWKQDIDGGIVEKVYG